MKEQMYRLIEDGKVVGEYTIKDIAARFKVTRETIYATKHRGGIYKKRWRIECSEEEESRKPFVKSIPDKLWQEWDRERLRLNPKAKR